MAVQRGGPETTLEEARPPSPSFLTAEQVRFFHTFGFVHVPGMFADEVGTISDGFDEIFAAETPDESRRPIHYEDVRLTIGPGFVQRSPKLSWLQTDPRLVGRITDLIGEAHDGNESDGNIFICDTGWHSDMFGASLDRLYVKVYFYLDPLDRDTGALRVMPGTNSHTSDYARGIRGLLWNPDGAPDAFGMDARDLPSWTIATEPGDVIFGDFRTLHATFGDGRARRLFTMNFSAPLEAVPAPGG
jgi:hypothetical protein